MICLIKYLYPGYYNCFTLHTEKGRELYIKLLNHAGKQSTIMADKYWGVYDNQENLINRYDIKP